MDKPWRPSDEYVKPQDRVQPEQCRHMLCTVVDKALFWLPGLLLVTAVLLLLQACSPHVVKRCTDAGKGVPRCECREATTGKYVRCP